MWKNYHLIPAGAVRSVSNPEAFVLENYRETTPSDNNN